MCGGSPVAQGRLREWPVWPLASSNLLLELRSVIESRRWSVTGAGDGSPTCEERFAEQFAAYHRVPYCVPTVNGTTALRLILLALGVGDGDEVIIPGLTWVSCATVVTDVGAVPVFADIDAKTACLAPDWISALKTPRTAAVMAVHLYCNVADLDAIMRQCDRHGLALIEDCAQSHGSEWNHQRVGTLGRAGAFSMHQGKPLTSGEGGAVITADEELARRVRQISNNGRGVMQSAPAMGRRRCEIAGIVQGTNAVLGEFPAAILLDGLANLDSQIAQKEENLKRLDAELALIPGVRVLTPSSPFITRRSPYHYLIHFDPGQFAGRRTEEIADALEAELGFSFARTYPPMNVHPLFQPKSLTSAKRRPEFAAALSREKSRKLPVAAGIHKESLIFRHSILLCPPSSVTLIVDAVAKVAQLAGSIPRLDHAVALRAIDPER